MMIPRAPTRIKLVLEDAQEYGKWLKQKGGHQAAGIVHSASSSSSGGCNVINPDSNEPMNSNGANLPPHQRIFGGGGTALQHGDHGTIIAPNTTRGPAGVVIQQRQQHGSRTGAFGGAFIGSSNFGGSASDDMISEIPHEAEYHGVLRRGQLLQPPGMGNTFSNQGHHHQQRPSRNRNGAGIADDEDDVEAMLLNDQAMMMDDRSQMEDISHSLEEFGQPNPGSASNIEHHNIMQGFSASEADSSGGTPLVSPGDVVVVQPSDGGGPMGQQQQQELPPQPLQQQLHHVPASTSILSSEEERRVQELLGLGFARQDAERALRMVEGDVQRAAALLMDN
ncbi:unnamed protein product [Amoebophrya sp. A120]|nr:unnamed protein product [Amoebophrya sp. A120]|eukprot:GSA120T00023618001.1